MQKIMFNDRYGLTQAVLEGRKTVTRRLISDEFFSLTWDVRNDTLVYENTDGDFIDIRNSKYCHYKVGDVLAVAQNYRDVCATGFRPDASILQRLEEHNIAGWKNKMFVKAELMPHQIRITRISIERLQDISDEDCLKEGIEFSHKAQSYYVGYHIEFSHKAQSYYVGYHKEIGVRTWLGKTPHEAFAALIDKISGRGTWDSNHYVVVYEFELVK